MISFYQNTLFEYLMHHLSFFLFFASKDKYRFYEVYESQLCDSSKKDFSKYGKPEYSGFMHSLCNSIVSIVYFLTNMKRNFGSFLHLNQYIQGQDFAVTFQLDFRCRFIFRRIAPLIIDYCACSMTIVRFCTSTEPPGGGGGCRKGLPHLTSLCDITWNRLFNVLPVC